MSLKFSFSFWREAYSFYLFGGLVCFGSEYNSENMPFPENSYIIWVLKTAFFAENWNLKVEAVPFECWGLHHIRNYVENFVK